MIVIRRDLKMRQGKACSQAAHASGEFMREALLKLMNGEHATISPVEAEWMRRGMAKITVRTDSLEQFDQVKKRAEEKGLKVRTITDSGRTEFKNIPTITAMAIGPDHVEKFEDVTDNLQLL